ncbi:MAG: hypothetical protein HOO88_06900 [Kiritimatiellaceae bacterium]|nr:hypothetical protein [Kiritimatiellaceae bacterium]
MKTEPFKICTTCSKHWETLEDFLADPELELSGYQVYFEDLKGGLFYFTHLHENCFTTLAIPVKAFTGLSNRPMLASRSDKPVCCPDLCVRKNELDPCPVECECIWVREIMQIIRDRKIQA